MKRVLVIEDQDAVKEVTKVMLELQGYAAVLADSPQDGIAKAGDKFDLILIDIMMPEMDGYEVARALRSDPALVRVPIVAVTSYAMVGDRERILAAGCTGYIEKPIDPAAFAVQVEQHLLAAKSKDEAP